ncbi:MAG TPA: hypothetical protein VEI29_06010 [Burkholderiaceae bacterium]|nr:hypothetical protein [Burkholderiaceae bacterium]
MSDLADAVHTQLLEAIPGDAKRVLEVGSADIGLEQRFKQTHPQVQWVGIDANFQARGAGPSPLQPARSLQPDQHELRRFGSDFDAVVVVNLLEQSLEAQGVLAQLYEMTAPGARIVSCLPNMAHVSVLQRMLAGDISYDDAGLLDRNHTRFLSPSSVFKTFLDSGWLPNLQKQFRVEPVQGQFLTHLVAAAQALGLPTATALRNFGLYQMVVVAEKWTKPQPIPMEHLAPFSVIVATNRPWQYELNIARSPGLREVGAQVVPVQGAANAAEAYAKGCTAARHAWRIFAHQDVYFPAGSGIAIAQQLAALDQDGRHDAPIGFAGLHADHGLESGLRYAGLVIDRTTLFCHPASARAVSIDEFAVILHRDAKVQIDRNLGWHLWATDLCLQLLEAGIDACGRVVQVPLFHNSTTAYELPQEFRASANLLMAKHARYPRVPTLCGQLTRLDPVAVPAT